MEARYNIYFAGQLLAGHALAGVRENIARLFNADDATLDKLFSGKAQLVKRDCDKATALKYKQAMEQAGARPVIKASAATAPPADTPAAAPRPMTAAERIAALAAGPDLAYQRKPDAAAAAPAVAPATDRAGGGIQLAPAGTAVLTPGERQPPASSTVQAPALEVHARGQRLSDAPPAPPPPPDTSHLSAGPAGERLPTLPSARAPLSPDTSAIALAPDGTDFSDCAAPEPAPPVLDLSGIALAGPGADVLEKQYRNRHDQPPPATDHLALED
ncbi:MAG: hypothetical protein KDI10_03385 [Halioglobus sp.]|nr:hypothetical protein [Halioglobus sp.]